MLRPGFSHLRAIFKFGGQSTVAAVVTSIAMDINDLVVGKVMGFSAVAMLSRAQGLMNLFHRDIMTAIRGVAFPAFAQAHRDGEAMDRKYVATVANVTVFAWPFYGLSALFPLEIMRLLFGPQWDAAASLVPIFCLAGAVAATFSLINPWMIAIGRNDLVTRAELIVQPLRVALVAIAAFIFKSLLACAIAFLAAFVIAAPIFYLFKQSAQRGDTRSLWKNLWRSAQVSIASLLVPLAIALKSDLGRDQPISLPLFGFAVLSAACAWFAAVHLLRHPISSDLLFRRITAVFSTRR
jgi:O-antigen/teichoic acid export membrane protein